MRSITLVLLVGIAHSVYGAAIERNAVCDGHPFGVKIPNPYDCGSFYVCDYGEPVLFKCHPRTRYDTQLQTCNWAEYVNCGNIPHPGTVEIPTVPIYPDTGNGNGLPPIAVDPIPLPLPGPVNPSNEVNSIELPAFPNPFDPNNPVVGEPTDANNDDDCGCTETEDETKPEHPPFPNIPELLGSEEGLDSIDGLSCLKPGFYFVPHPNNCEQYYICENQKIHAHQCANGVHWDYVANQCDVPDRAICYAIVFGTLDDTTKPELPTPPIGEPIVPEPIPEPEIPSIPEVQPEVPEEPERPPPVINPVTDSPEELCDGSSEYIQHASDCRKYYICIAGMAIETSCPENHYWNADGLFCTDKEKANCLVN